MKHGYRVIGLFPGGIRVVENLFRTDPDRCAYFVCDTDPAVLEASPVPGKAILQMDAVSFPEGIMEGAETLVVVAILEGADAASRAKALVRMTEDAKKRGLYVHGVISPPFDRREHDAVFDVMDVEKWEDSYFQVIDPRLQAFSFRYRPGVEAMRTRMMADMTGEAERLVDAQLRCEARFAPILRKLDELIAAQEADIVAAADPDDEQPIKTEQ